MTERRRLVRVPASSANLGPGYDVLAAALALHLELKVRKAGEFARTVAFVPFDAASYVTGHTIVVDGGWLT